MMEEVYNSYYTLAILAFLANNYEETENWLNKLSQLILKETKINTDLFLAVRNLQALALAAQKKEAPAADLLKSTIRSAPSSLTRYYLMYNLAVLHAKNRNLTQMNHYLTEALKLNPALTVAKKLQAKYAKQ
jgi:tetratricopeptide (TPR) repeat protein